MFDDRAYLTELMNLRYLQIITSNTPKRILPNTHNPKSFIETTLFLLARH